MAALRLIGNSLIGDYCGGGEEGRVPAECDEEEEEGRWIPDWDGGIL